MSDLEQKEISLEQVNVILNALGQQIYDAFRASNFERAEQLLKRILEIAPKQAFAWMNLASAHLRQRKYQHAYDASLKAIEYMADNVDPNVYDGLAEICHQLDRFDEQIYYGKLAIQVKKHQLKDVPQIDISQNNRPRFDPQKPTQNIISYSLFGSLPRYCEVAVLNVQLAKEIYPEWICRFYVDDTVPPQVIARLQQHGAQVIQVSDAQKQISGLFWRFLVLDDKDVQYFLIRDADSLLSYRERSAVDQWLNSTRWFHKMHDSYSHTELILAGMWGGCHGIFKNIMQSIQQFIQKNQISDPRVIDQHYLRQQIWPTLQHSVFIHDSQGYESNAQDFPTPSQQKEFEQSQRFHVGANEGASTVNICLAHPVSKEIQFYIKDSLSEEVICAYDFISNYATDFSILLPDSYGKKIQSEEWYIATKIKA